MVAKRRKGKKSISVSASEMANKQLGEDDDDSGVGKKRGRTLMRRERGGSQRIKAIASECGDSTVSTVALCCLWSPQMTFY